MVKDIPSKATTQGMKECFFLNYHEDRNEN